MHLNSEEHRGVETTEEVTKVVVFGGALCFWNVNNDAKCFGILK